MSNSNQTLREELAGTEVAGFGDNAVRLKNGNGEVLAYIGKQNGEEKVYFNRPLSPDQVEAVNDLLQRKKLRKALHKDNFEKAQTIADRKFDA